MEQGLDTHTNEKAPLFNQWKWWYVLLGGWLGILILFFYIITQFFK